MKSMHSLKDSNETQSKWIAIHHPQLATVEVEENRLQRNFHMSLNHDGRK